MFELSVLSYERVTRGYNGRFCKPFISLIANKHTRPRHYNYCVRQSKAGKPFCSVWIMFTGKPGPVSSLTRPWYEHLDF